MRKLRTIEMKRLSIDEFKEAPKLPLVVVLDDVRSLYNVGSVFRSCDAFRVEAVYLCGITACPPNAEIHKTALGGEDSVEWKYFEQAEEAVRVLQKDGYFVYSIEQVEGSTQLQDLNLVRDSQNGGRYAVVFGNEVKGVKQTFAQRQRNGRHRCLGVCQGTRVVEAHDLSCRLLLLQKGAEDNVSRAIICF